jgi:hypothetical protein
MPLKNSANAAFKLDRAKWDSIINNATSPGTPVDAYQFPQLLLAVRSLDFLRTAVTNLGGDPDEAIADLAALYLASRADKGSHGEPIKARRRRSKNAPLPDHPRQTFIPGTMPSQPEAN